MIRIVPYKYVIFNTRSARFSLKCSRCIPERSFAVTLVIQLTNLQSETYLPIHIKRARFFFFFLLRIFRRALSLRSANSYLCVYSEAFAIVIESRPFICPLICMLVSSQYLFLVISKLPSMRMHRDTLKPRATFQVKNIQF